MVTWARGPLALLILCSALSPRVYAQEQPANTTETPVLEEVVVTGTLIPQVSQPTAVPLTVITLDDLQQRGFASVADVLQQSTYATGSVQGPQATNGFTPGARTLSMFGLSPSYVKYMLDGKPMSDYPALYNATNMITNLGGIATELIDHIDVVPGGQSSLYGSDAIAGVVNVILKHELDGPLIDVRYGSYTQGGGLDKRVALADSFQRGIFSLLLGAQYERTDPIWGYQRALTSSPYMAGGGPPIQSAVASATEFFPGSGQIVPDPNNCGRLSSLLGNSVREYTDAGTGTFCGTTQLGYYTLANAQESAQFYSKATMDLTDGLRLHADLQLNNDIQRLTRGTDGVYTGYFFDPQIGQILDLSKSLSPEEVGDLGSELNRLTTNAYRASVGLDGKLASWSYDIDGMYQENKLDRLNHVLFTAGMNSYLAAILGPNFGPDPFFGAFPTYVPNYSAFFTPLTAAQYASLSGYAASHSRTSDSLFRATLTNSDLLDLWGRSVGVAILAEGGREAWSYNPDPVYLTDGVVGYVATTGGGDRSRYALAGELRIPILDWATLSASSRFDDYLVTGNDFGRGTYSLGVEVRPVKVLTLRGRFSTAFRAPSLADEFQGPSQFGAFATDYFKCGLLGFSGATLNQCPYSSQFIDGTTSGNPQLKPITAQVWDAGAVLSPLSNLEFSMDFLHWGIRNETYPEDVNFVLETEAECRLGTLNINSAACKAALSQVIRDSGGFLTNVIVPKINIANETADAVTARASYAFDLGRLGAVSLNTSWNDMLKHAFQEYPTDTPVDELGDPTQSTDFKSKVDASMSWSWHSLGATLYGVRDGRTPNLAAQAAGYGTPGAGTLGPWTVVNASLRYQWASRLRLSVTMDNLFDRHPPIDKSYSTAGPIPYNAADYNDYGRAYYVEATYGVH